MPMGGMRGLMRPGRASPGVVTIPGMGAATLLIPGNSGSPGRRGRDSGPSEGLIGLKEEDSLMEFGPEAVPLSRPSRLLGGRPLTALGRCY